MASVSCKKKILCLSFIVISIISSRLFSNPQMFQVMSFTFPWVFNDSLGCFCFILLELGNNMWCGLSFPTKDISNFICSVVGSCLKKVKSNLLSAFLCLNLSILQTLMFLCLTLVHNSLLDRSFLFKLLSYGVVSLLSFACHLNLLVSGSDTNTCQLGVNINLIFFLTKEKRFLEICFKIFKTH